MYVPKHNKFTISSISLHNPTNLNAMIFICFSLIHSMHFAVTGLKVGKLVFRNIKENCGMYPVTLRLKKKGGKGEGVAMLVRVL